MANILIELDHLNRAIQEALDDAGVDLIEVMKDLRPAMDARNKNVTAAATIGTKLGLSLATTGERRNRAQRLHAEERLSGAVGGNMAEPSGDGVTNWIERARQVKGKR
jgi:hypothetical protein